jgi:DNA-binding NarL/FixJ family response regulator
MPVRIVLADDHALVRAGVHGLLESVPSIDVVGEATDGRSALEMVERLRPDVILMDFTMPNLNGLDATRRVIKECPSVRVIMLSMHDDIGHVWQALEAGAAGYLAKDSSREELVLAIQAVARGGSYLSPVVSQRVLQDYVRNGGTGHDEAVQLTPRQREVVQLMAEGHTNVEIAATLGLSVKTVETHRAALMDRLDVHNLAGVVRYAVRSGLVSLD